MPEAKQVRVAARRGDLVGRDVKGRRAPPQAAGDAVLLLQELAVACGARGDTRRRALLRAAVRGL